jgi:Lrp/AsnC family transcriptional regulator, leucine-responsive regulatory protein
MDEKDAMLLAALRRDARRTLVALARDIGLSRSATQERLERLLRSGVIEGFTTVEGKGLERRTCAHFLLKHQSGRTCAQLVPKLRKIAGIVSIHSVAGAIDLVIEAEGTDVSVIEGVRSAIANLPEVAELTTLMVLERHLG